MSSKIRVRLFQDQKFVVRDFKSFLSLTIREILTEPWVVRVDHEKKTVYFTESQEVSCLFKAEEKTVFWLSELINAFQKDLLSLGYPPISIWEKTLRELKILRLTLKTFPDSEVSIEENPVETHANTQKIRFGDRRPLGESNS